jgi:hypothetical protein
MASHEMPWHRTSPDQGLEGGIVEGHCADVPQLELRVIAKPEHSATANPIYDLYGIVRH